MDQPGLARPVGPHRRRARCGCRDGSAADPAAVGRRRRGRRPAAEGAVGEADRRHAAAAPGPSRCRSGLAATAVAQERLGGDLDPRPRRGDPVGASARGAARPRQLRLRRRRDQRAGLRRRRRPERSASSRPARPRRRGPGLPRHPDRRVRRARVGAVGQVRRQLRPAAHVARCCGVPLRTPQRGAAAPAQLRAPATGPRDQRQRRARSRGPTTCSPSGSSGGGRRHTAPTAALVSLKVAPPTRTRSVVKNRALAAAYAGAHRFGIEVFEPGTANTLMAALLVHDLRTGAPAQRAPVAGRGVCRRARRAVDGGLRPAQRPRARRAARRCAAR